MLLTRHLSSARRRGIVAASAALVVAGLLAGCGAGGVDASGSPLDSVTVDGDVNSKPTVSFDAKPFSLTTSAIKVLTAGDGDSTVATDNVQLQYSLINGADGKEIQSSYEQGPVTVSLSDPQGLKYLLSSLTDQKIGSRLLIGVAPADGFGDQTGASAPFKPEDTLLYVVDLIGKVADKADGEAVTDVPADLPKVQTDSDGKVTGITVPGGEPPTELVVQPLIKGTGAALTADSTVTAHYWGVLWSDGSTFDSSWQKGAPVPFSLSGVIPGWTQGLTGQTIGSRVLLVIPPDLGYGDKEQNGIPAGSTLVFAVDILAG